MTQRTLQIRVNPRSGAPRFYRCGLEFTGEWREVEVDAATAARLEAEQMLEVRQESGDGDQESEKPVDDPTPKPAAKKTKAKTK
ncbi:MAG: hypothetical protein LBF93_06695 [Zoogloeaceae bacterium]|jgi:hypothetical protein|nr:hypothetical protein [Zoogloeaceae bacterium]